MSFDPVYPLLEKVDDEQSFIRFLRAMREDYEKTERECRGFGPECMEQGHWESRSIRDFLRSAEEWANGDFGEGVHHGEPILRRVAVMLYVGRYKTREE